MLTILMLLMHLAEIIMLGIILAQLRDILTWEGGELMTLAELRTTVEANTSVTQSAIVLLQGLKTKLDEALASGDPAQVQAIADELGANTDALAAAVAANTPAEAPTA